MKPIATKDLNQSLILLTLEREDDGEGGWKDSWKKGPTLWASLWPLMGDIENNPLKNKPLHSYKIILRSGINLPNPLGFLWTLKSGAKTLFATSAPVLIQQNQFLSLTAKEERNG